MFDDVRISVASHKIHSTLKSSPGGRNGFLMVLGRCRRVWRLYDFDVVWILDYFFVHATRHSPAWHLTTPYLCHSITNHNIHLKLSADQWHQVQESNHERAQIEKTKNVRARGALGILPQVEDNDWVWLGYVAILIWYDYMIVCMENTQMWFMFLQIIHPIYYIESALVIIDSCQVEFAPGLWAQLEWLLFHHVSPSSSIQSDSVEAQCRDCLLPMWIMWAQSVGPDVIWIVLIWDCLAWQGQRKETHTT